VVGGRRQTHAVPGHVHVVDGVLPPESTSTRGDSTQLQHGAQHDDAGDGQEADDGAEEGVAVARPGRGVDGALGRRCVGDGQFKRHLGTPGRVLGRAAVVARVVGGGDRDQGEHADDSWLPVFARGAPSHGHQRRWRCKHLLPRTVILMCEIRKIIKMIVSRCHILRLKCAKFDSWRLSVCLIVRLSVFLSLR